MECGPLSANTEWWLSALVFVIYSFFERWLGRTNKTRAASLLDLLGVGFRRIFGIKQKTQLVVKDGEPLEGPQK
jgi:hypothetical protein